MYSTVPVCRCIEFSILEKTRKIFYMSMKTVGYCTLAKQLKYLCTIDYCTVLITHKYVCNGY
jgi:hypothetical protein